MNNNPKTHGNIYGDPVQRLLHVGEATDCDPASWIDYPTTFGLGPEHVPELIRMACDRALHHGDPGRNPVWAPLHAVRALGQLQAATAVAPLLAYLVTDGEDTAPEEELADVLGMIGPAAIPLIAEFLADRSRPVFAANGAMEGLMKISARHPAYRDDCVGILVAVLEQHPRAEPTVNGFAISNLIDLAAVEAIDAIRAAFRRDAVDVSIAGDEEDVEIALGLRDRRVTPKPFYSLFSPHRAGQPDAAPLHAAQVVPPRVKVGRNDPCPCGSGRKYKKCCLN